MKIQEIIQMIDDYNVSEGTEEYEMNVFFDEIGDKINNLEGIEEGEKEQLIKSLFNFQKRQAPELEENFSFIHLIESIDKPNYKNYNLWLIEFNINSPTITSILLLNRYINSLKGKDKGKMIEILKMISEKKEQPELLIESALDFYQYQIKNK